MSFWGLAWDRIKVHQINLLYIIHYSDRDGIEKLPIRPIISNLNTATYHLAKYLVKKLLSPLSTSAITVSNSKEIMTTIKNVQLPSGYHMVSFDVKSLFTNASLEYT